MEKIHLFRVRDIGDILRDTFALLKAQATPLWKNVFTIVIPGFIIIAVGMVVTLKDLLLLAQEIQAGGAIENSGEMLDSLKSVISSPTMWAGFGVIIICSLFIQGFMNSLVFNYVEAYDKGNEESKNPDSLRAKSIGDIGWYVGYSLLLGFAVLGIAIVLMGGGALSGSALLTFLLGMALFVGIFVVLPVFVLFFPVAFLERTSFAESWNRARYLTKGEWGTTIGVVIIMALLGGVASSIVSGILSLIGSMFGEFGKLLFSQIGQLGMTGFIGIFSATAYSLLYGSLRAKKEGADDGVLGNDLIDEIGKKKDEDTTQTW